MTADIPGKTAVKQPDVAKAGQSAGGASSLFSGEFLKLFKNAHRYLNIELINIIIGICIVFLVFWFIAIVRGSERMLQTGNNFVLTQAEKAASDFKAEELAAVKSLAFYIDKIGKRDIFRMTGRVKDESATAVSSKFTELTGGLKLVGISWSDYPDAMIEDTKLEKTYFVKKGQFVGEMKVENIFKDKVILRYNKETFELK